MKLTCSYCGGSSHVPMGHGELVGFFGLQHIALHMGSGERAPNSYSVLLTCACGAELKQGPHAAPTAEEQREQVEQFFREHALHEGD